MVKLAIYPGSFDPLTHGHMDVIERSLKFCDKLVVAIGNNKSKESLFSIDEKKYMLNEALKSFNNGRIEVLSYDSLLIDFAKSINAQIIIRGIRALSDFDFEFNLAGVNYKLAPQIETIFLSASENYQFISSRVVKEIAEFGGDLSKFVPQVVNLKIKDKLNSDKK